MEDVLDVYQRPYDKNCPVICMDEKPLQLLDETRQPIPMGIGQPRREDYEYVRKGTCSIFIFTEPLASWRTACARERRTRKDWAEQIRLLLEVYYPQAPKVCLVMDNLNTHTLASLYEAFPAQKARELAKRLEIHYTPKHGSWLNIAEIELNAMTTQCLGRRFGTLDKLETELSAWASARNSHAKSVHWQFSSSDARVKLHHLYPSF